MRLQFYMAYRYDATQFKCVCVLSELNINLVEFPLEGSPARWMGQIRNPAFHDQTIKAFCESCKDIVENVEKLPIEYNTQHYKADISDAYLLTHNNKRIALYAAKILSKEMEGTS
jgi:hypothetical protein